MATSNDVVIHHKLGLHARPAAMFVKTAAKFSSRITLENLSRGTQPVNAKSILSVLSAGVKKDEQIRITAEGTDEAAAVNALTELIASNFGEAEREPFIMSQTNQPSAHASGTLTLGGDLTVYRLGFGAMRITGEGIWGPPADKAEALAVLRRTLDLGINLIDTADSYGPNVSEELIAEALYPYPKDLVIATKGGLLRTGPGQWPLDGRPEHLREALEGSLKRLRLDHIDIYQFHRPDPKVPFEDSVGEIARMREEGKIRHVGLSNVTLDELARAQKIVPIVTVQNHYNLANRKSERMTVAESDEMVDVCARQGIGFIPWSPLSAGSLAREGSVLDQIAKDHNAKPTQIALAWLLKRSSTMLPIPGTGSVKHLEENAIGATFKLTQAEFDSIDRARQQE